MLCFTCFFPAFSLCLFQLNNDPSQQAHCLDSAEALLADSVGSVVCKTKSFARVTHCCSPTCTLYYAVLLTHLVIVLLTNNIWSSNPITPAHSFHQHHKNPKKKINCLEKPHFDTVVDSPTCGFNCRPRISSISKLGLMQQYLYTP